MIELQRIEKYYGGKSNRFKVLKQISLTIADGDFAVILGASGSGKSTLLHIMSGLERPDGGAVLYDGQDITALSDSQLTAFRRKTIGFIFQQYALLPHMNVENNVKMGAALAKNTAYPALLEALGLQDKRRKYPGELSGGEQQRTAIARALAKRPQVLFLDEPTGALDEETGRQVLQTICELQKSHGFTMIMVTHNSHIAETAKTIIRMHSGSIAEMYQNPTQKTAYEIGW